MGCVKWSMIFLFTTLSNTFMICEVRLTGLYLSGFNFEPPLCMGVTCAILCMLCIFPSSMLFLRISFNGSAIVSFVLINNIAGTQSEPCRICIQFSDCICYIHFTYLDIYHIVI